MFCPKCKYEYKEGILVCPDCDIELVEKLPEIKVLNFDTIELCEVEDEFEAYLIISLLEENNIECFLRENFLPHTRVTLGEKRKYATIIINREKLEDAKIIIENFKTEK